MHTRLSSEFQHQNNHQDLLHMAHPLFNQVNYF